MPPIEVDLPIEARPVWEADDPEGRVKAIEEK
jgi:hypothetical protein